jgi:hypothetical protein
MQGLLLIGPQKEPLEIFPLAPPDACPDLEVPVFLPPPQVSLIPSPTKRGRASDAKQRLKRRRVTSSFNPELGVPSGESLPGAELECFGEGPAEDGSGYEEFADAVLSECAGFTQISSDLYVAQGWDTKKSETTVGELH